MSHDGLVRGGNDLAVMFALMLALILLVVLAVLIWVGQNVA